MLKLNHIPTICINIVSLVIQNFSEKMSRPDVSNFSNRSRILAFFSGNDNDETIFVDSSFRVLADSMEEQHAPSKPLSPRHSKELKIPARPRVEEVDDGGWRLGRGRQQANEERGDEEANADKALDIRLMLEAADRSRRTSRAVRPYTTAMVIPL